jgi:hypothetical protein
MQEQAWTAFFPQTILLGAAFCFLFAGLEGFTCSLKPVLVPHLRIAAAGRKSLTFPLENRYTTLVWRFLPVAVEADVRPEVAGLSVSRPRTKSFPPELF